MINMAFNRDAHTRLVILPAKYGRNDTKTAPAAVRELFINYAPVFTSDAALYLASTIIHHQYLQVFRHRC